MELEIGKKYTFIYNTMLNKLEMKTFKVNHKTRYGYNVTIANSLFRSDKLFVYDGDLSFYKGKQKIHILSDVEKDILMNQITLEYLNARLDNIVSYIASDEYNIKLKKIDLQKHKKEAQLLQEKILLQTNNMKKFNKEDVELFKKIQTKLKGE